MDRDNIINPAFFFLLGMGLVCLALVLSTLRSFTHLAPLEIGLFFLLFAAAAAAFFLYLRETRKSRRDYDSMKNQLIRAQLISKRKARLAEYFDRVLRDAADIIFTLDIDGYILKFNTGAETILGYKQHEIVGTPFSNMLSDPSDATRIFDMVLTHDSVQNQELKMHARDGRIVEVSLSISEMRDERNQIFGMVATCKDITEKKRLEKRLLEQNAKLEELAITDNLSGLFNVRHFHSEINEAFTRVKRRLYSYFSLLLIDIDKFKELNDSEGHKRGDMVIEQLGEIIRSCIRRDLDSGFRYGGDEFVVILLDTDPQKSVVVAERILERFRTLKFGHTSLSIGIAGATGEDNEEALVHRADLAMYQAKRSGGNRYQIANQE